MQFVLWFAGLRGAIAFALAENMPGSNRDNYASSTLMICIITTVLFGGCTEKILTRFGMKQDSDQLTSGLKSFSEEDEMVTMMVSDPVTRGELTKVYNGLKGICLRLDEKYLKRFFGGPGGDGHRSDNLGDYELKTELSNSSLNLEYEPNDSGKSEEGF
jgi:sodium/hydrogen exchanger 8